jgi:hypothetical protein
VNNSILYRTPPHRSTIGLRPKERVLTRPFHFLISLHRVVGVVQGKRNELLVCASVLSLFGAQALSVSRQLMPSKENLYRLISHNTSTNMPFKINQLSEYRQISRYSVTTSPSDRTKQNPSDQFIFLFSWQKGQEVVIDDLDLWMCLDGSSSILRSSRAARGGEFDALLYRRGLAPMGWKIFSFSHRKEMNCMRRRKSPSVLPSCNSTLSFR